MEAIQPDAYVEPDRTEPMEGAERGGFYGIHRGIQGRTLALPSGQEEKYGIHRSIQGCTLALPSGQEEKPIVRPMTEVAPRGIAPADRRLAEALAELNHRARNRFWSLRRHGVSEAAALEATWRALPR